MPFVRGSVRNSRRRALATLPSLFTLGNMMCGVASILVAIQGDFRLAAVLIGISVVLDITDGAVARLVGAVTPFGLQFDSLADLVSFGLAPALLASGSLPLIMQPVRDVPGAPPGNYWDGGIIDYHLALPYARQPAQLVLYPHFGEHIVPGWLDKAMPWRRAARGPNRGWLDNVLIVAPSAEFLSTLPRGRLIDRSDFKFYGLDHDARVQAWSRAMDEGERLRDAFAAFVEKPDLSLIRPL